MCCRYHNTWLQAILLVSRNKKQNGIHKTRHRSATGVEDPDTGLHSSSHLIFSKNSRKSYWRKDVLSNKWSWRRMKSSPCLQPTQNSTPSGLRTTEWDLKLLHETVGSSLHNTDPGKDFMERTHGTQEASQQMDLHETPTLSEG